MNKNEYLMYHNNTYMKHSSDLEFQVASRSINFWDTII